MNVDRTITSTKRASQDPTYAHEQQDTSKQMKTTNNYVTESKYVRKETDKQEVFDKALKTAADVIAKHNVEEKEN